MPLSISSARCAAGARPLLRFFTGAVLLALACSSLAQPAHGKPDADVQPPLPGGLAPSTPSGIGVWYRPDAPRTGSLWRPGDPGDRLLLRGRVLDTAARPRAGARVEIWHADAAGVVHEDRLRATLITGADGSFRVSTVLPGYIWGPRHIHVLINHPDHDTFVTRLYFRRDPELQRWGRDGVPVFLEDGHLDDAPALFGRVQIVLP